MLKNDLIEKIEIILAQSQYSDLKVEILRPGSNMVDIVTTKMYDYVEVSFEQLTLLSELFGTRKINLGDRESWGGCETCDYGSKYQLTIHLNDVTLDIE